MRILLDNGIFSHSEFAEKTSKRTEILWGETLKVFDVHGYRRKKPHEDKEYQNQIDALFTVGRLIRKGHIEAFDYNEIHYEGMRDTAKIPYFNALPREKVHRCCPALERSKFRQTINFMEFISKGGKKDVKAGKNLGKATQMAFLNWLNDLPKEHVDLIIEHAAHIGLTEFETESLKDIAWYQALCSRSVSENYPDIFHVWTAERNGFAAFLTLEKRLPNFINGIKKENVKRVAIKVEVLRPLDLLQRLGVEKPDPVPIELERFYNLFEVTG